MDLGQVLGIVRIDEGAQSEECVARADLVLVERDTPRRVDGEGVVIFSLMTISDMKRPPGSGSVTVTGPASRSTTAEEERPQRVAPNRFAAKDPRHLIEAPALRLCHPFATAPAATSARSSRPS
jgi:hypothetical protein